MRRPLLAAAVALVLAAGVAAPPAHAAPAVHPDNRPTPVPGRTNGQLHPSDLIVVGPSCIAYRPAATSLALLLAAARHQGVDLATSECYRPYDNQIEERRQWGPCAARPGTSMHGWGKAVDFRDARGGLTFSSPAYGWLTANAAAYGWNHPGWAGPGGSGCDEPWHWEWVGDGGIMGGDPVRADIVGVMTKPGGGWWSVTGLGAVTAADGASSHGGAENLPLQRLVVGGAATPDGGGYWLVAADGGVFTFGNAGFHGSMGGKPLNQPVVGMASTATGNGYWLVASDGGIFTFGDAAFLGSQGGTPLNKPVVGMAPTPSGNGYWLVASDGGIFTFGDAAFRGSLGGRPTAPVAGMAPAGDGYRLVAVDGVVTSFGTS